MFIHTFCLYMGGVERVKYAYLIVTVRQYAVKVVMQEHCTI